MAMGEPNSNQREWVQSFQRNIFSQPTGGTGSSSRGIVFSGAYPMTESTAVTTTTASASCSATPGGDRVQPPVGEGRAGKAARRRSRASRKAPTTVLNTDTTNFRAMVQQYTGVPPGPFQAGYPHMAEGRAGGVPATLTFGLGGGATRLHQQQAAVFPFGVQQQQFQQHHERPLFMVGGNGSRDIYLRATGGNAQRGSMDAPEGLMPGSNPSTQAMSTAAASTGSTTIDGFLLR